MYHCVKQDKERTIRNDPTEEANTEPGQAMKQSVRELVR
jgi:hypothetical protein